MTVDEPTLDERFGALLAGDQDGLADPYPLYRELAERGPIYDFGGTLLVTGHAATMDIIRSDGRRFLNALTLRGEAAERIRAGLSGEALEGYDALARFYSLVLPERTKDDHTRLRSIVHRTFTPRRMQELGAAIERYVAQLLDEVESADAPDLAHVSDRLPLMVVSDMLGVPHSELDRLQASIAKTGATRGADAGPETYVLALEGLRELYDYATELVERPAVAEDSSVVWHLVQAERESRISREELAAMLVFLIASAQETTTSLLSVGSIALLQNRVQWAALCTDPEGLAPAATEELLRFISPVQFTSRVALEDCEVAGTPIAEDQQLFLVLAAANRDPAAFDRPDALDLGRDDVGAQLGLGFGIHFCLGAALLRLESRLYLSALARRFPGLEVATDRFDWIRNLQTRRPTSVPVSLG